jgi:phosphohistidine phosphatase
MQRLILMRHAKTEPWTEGMDDFARMLTPRGHEDAARMVAALAGMGWSADRILISPSRRTRETASIVAATFQRETVRPVEALYLATPPIIEEAIQRAADVRTLMIIGHNPGLHEFAVALSERGPSGDAEARMRLIEKLPTSGVALFEAADDAPGFHPSELKLVETLRASEMRD